MTYRLHLATDLDQPYKTVKRKLRHHNVGFYCSHCGEFFAFAVIDPKRRIPPVEYVAEGPVLFQCPLCDKRQFREVSEIVEFVLTERNRRKSPPHGPH